MKQLLMIMVDFLYLAPMSAVAGRMSVQAGAHCLEKNQKGRGLLLGGAPELLVEQL